MTYSEYLYTQHWQRKRFETLELYGYCCARCPTTTHLQVHHVHYRKNGKPIWFKEVAGEDLIVLCALCHKRMHSAEKLDPERVKQTTLDMLGGKNIHKIPSTTRYRPTSITKPPVLTSTKLMHTWSIEKRRAYKKLKKERLKWFKEQRGGK